jgi:hypothetical protein
LPASKSSENLASRATVGDLLEAVVVRYGPARRQRAPLRGDPLDRPSELDLGLVEPAAFAAVLAGLAGKRMSGSAGSDAKSTPAPWAQLQATRAASIAA